MHTQDYGLSLLEKVAGSTTTGLSYWDSAGHCLYANESFLTWQEAGINGLPSEILPGCLQAGEILFQVLQGNVENLLLDATVASRRCSIRYIPDPEGCLVQMCEVSTVQSQKARPTSSTRGEQSLESTTSRYYRALRRQQQQMESILGSISESFCLLDASWQIRYWNPAAEKATGKLRQAVLGRSLWEVFPQAHGSTLYSGCETVMRTRQSASFEHHGAEGTWFYNSVHPNGDGGLTIYFKDITDRKRAENEIIAIKNNQHALINATRDLMWSVDGDYRLISANRAFTDYAEGMLGFRPGQGDAVLFGEGWRGPNSEWKRLLDRGLQGESFFTEARSTPDQLTQFNPIEDPVSGKITGVACHSANISERNRLERESIQSAERFQAVVQHGSDLIFILDAGFSLNYISPSAAALLGYSTGMKAGALLELVHPENGERVRRVIRRTASKRVVKMDGFRMRNAHGGWTWIEATIANLLDNPAVCGLVVNACDITESKSREAERELLIKELTRSNNDLMQFSFITSHNLRAPLSNITGLLAAFDRSALDPESAGVLELIGASTQKLTQTISDLSQILIIRNSPEIPTGWLDIGRVFGRVNRNFIEAENDIDARLSLRLEATHANFNEGYLESIFINLISNAIKYRSPERTLAISLETRQQDKGVLLSFRDNGKGIDLERHRTRLFGMYQRFHPNTEGQGLGLFIIKEQIRALGGRVDVESTVGAGTAFHILLPLGV